MRSTSSDNGAGETARRASPLPSSPEASTTSSSPSSEPSVTEILAWINPATLPPSTVTLLNELGPYLTRGLTYVEIARKLDHSEDWVSSRVRTLREDLARNALDEAGDDMRSELRARLAEYVS